VILSARTPPQWLPRLVSGTPLDVLAARFAAFWLWSEFRSRSIAVPGGDASGSR
jgi:hypothetical protein